MTLRKFPEASTKVLSDWIFKASSSAKKTYHLGWRNHRERPFVVLFFVGRSFISGSQRRSWHCHRRGEFLGGWKNNSQGFVIQRVSLPQKEPLAVSIFEMFLTKLSFLPGAFENRSVCFLVRDIDAITRWWQLKYFPFSPRTLGKMNPFWWAYFSSGLVQPPTRSFLGTRYLRDTDSH